MFDDSSEMYDKKQSPNEKKKKNVFFNFFNA